MNFMEIAQARQSCRAYDESRPVEEEKLKSILEAARLSPSACNGQPYHITVCQGALAKEVALLTRGLGGMNKFAVQAPVMLIISEMPYVKSAALGAKVKNNDYRSMDIGIACAYLTAEAAAQGLGTCILGWFDDEKVRKLCDIEHPIRLIITLGYAKEGDPLRKKMRKDLSDLVSWKE
jgi:nitroreductase